jgi:hypothetical protein
MINRMHSAIVVTASLSLFACSSEPRTVPYFQKNIDDPTKVFTGTDECTNAHIAVKKWETAKYNKERREANARAIREGRFMPVIKQ